MIAPENKKIGNTFVTVNELASLRGECKLTILRMIREGRLPKPERVLHHFVWAREKLEMLLAVPAKKNRRQRRQAQADDWIEKCPGTAEIDGAKRPSRRSTIAFAIVQPYLPFNAASARST